MHRLWGLRAGLPGLRDFRAGRPSRKVEALHGTKRELRPGRQVHARRVCQAQGSKVDAQAPQSLSEPSSKPFRGSFRLSYQGRSPVARRPNMNLPLAQVGIALFSPKESHRRLIFDILRAIHDCNHLAPGANSVACTNVLRNFLEVALLWIPVAPD